MRLLLVRHADADTVASSDDARRLSEKGHKQAKAVAKYLAALDLKVDRILTSPLPRAKETAAYLVEALGKKECIEDARLAPGMQPEEACEILKDGDEEEFVAWVGHEPDFSRFLAWLIGLDDPHHIEVKKSGVALLEIETPRRGGGILQVLLPPKWLSSGRT